MREICKKVCYWLFDILMMPLTMVITPVLFFIRKHGVRNFSFHQRFFRFAGIFPLRDHYYEPQFNFPGGYDPSVHRSLQIDLREQEQLAFLQSMAHVAELSDLKVSGVGMYEYYLDNPAFSAGDAEAYYLMIRNKKPARIIEIGSGFSTKLALLAIQKNKEEGHITRLTCIEPYEMPWLDGENRIELIRSRVEEVSLSLFTELKENDILFIDSSHIIRPANDVLYEYLQILPLIPKGVFIHIHDIFTPRDYPHHWIVKENRFWNEQYLLEALLTYSPDFKPLLSVNHLKQTCFPQIKDIFIHLTEASEPGSFWLVRQ